MKAEELKSIQAPLKQQYKNEPEVAIITLSARGQIGNGITCKVDTGKAIAEAGLHPATGGDGTSLCSGDMLLEALIGCAGVTLRAVATAMEIPLRGGRMTLGTWQAVFFCEFDGPRTRHVVVAVAGE